MNRRSFLYTAAATAMTPQWLAAQAAALPPVPPLDSSKIKPSDFSDADLDMPFALSHFARLANSMLLEGPDAGFLTLSVWRGTANLHPYNARIMENILTLTWFYVTDRPWNQYRGHPALRARLELALTYWCGLQGPGGEFSEYGVKEWNLAATSFAVKFFAEALRLLKQAGSPAIDSVLHQRAIDAIHKAMRSVLFDPEMYSHGLTFSNQYTNIFAGGAAFLAMYPDAELEARLHQRLAEAGTKLQSPCGYMYEGDGPDLGYTLNTHHENLAMAWNYWRGTPLATTLVEEENRFADWLQYNALPEPGQPFFVLNRGIETRQQHATYGAVDTPLAERCPLMRVFATSPSRRAEQISAARAKLNREWPQVDPLVVGEFGALSPYLFLMRSLHEWHPTQAQMDEAQHLYRPLRETSFVEQLKDSREPIVFTYVRRPTYYAAFAAAPKTVTPQERLGLTLLWSPERGVLLQSQTNGGETAWGTAAGNTSHEGTGLDVTYADNNTTMRYPLLRGGTKTVRFEQDQVRVTVEMPGEIVEHVPVFDPGCVHSETVRRVLDQTKSPVLGKTFHVVELRATDKLEYTLRP